MRHCLSGQPERSPAQHRLVALQLPLQEGLLN